MKPEQQDIIDELQGRLTSGTLDEEGLTEGIETLLAADQKQGRQNLLYLQTSQTSPDRSPVVGMKLFEDGELVEFGNDANDWPYNTVMEAVKDGWRIISFPNMALLLVNDNETHGLGVEFILEKWR